MGTDPVQDEWQNWHIFDNQMWSTRDIPDLVSSGEFIACDPNNPTPPSTCANKFFQAWTDVVVGLQTDYPNAIILSVNIEIGNSSGGAPWNDYVGNIDAFEMNVSSTITAYDFENPPTFLCVAGGFKPPFHEPLTLAKKAKKAIPVKMMLADSDGNPITDADITAPPVVNVLFNSTTYGDTGAGDDVDLLPLGQANDDNVFRFDGFSGTWFYGLGTKILSAPGTYTVKAVSGDETEYSIDATCTETFLRLD